MIHACWLRAFSASRCPACPSSIFVVLLFSFPLIYRAACLPAIQKESGRQGMQTTVLACGVAHPRRHGERVVMVNAYALAAHSAVDVCKLVAWLPCGAFPMLLLWSGPASCVLSSEQQNAWLCLVCLVMELIALCPMHVQVGVRGCNGVGSTH